MAEEIKKKRGRPRKSPLPEEIQQIVEEVQQKEEQEFKEVIAQVKAERRANQLWDYKLGDSIDFFDTTLSYELTGYRPINDKEGLDFDPSWFTEARETFLRTNHYCQFPRNSKAYADFWTQEYIRCRDGMTVNGYTITGDNYFFLNYYQLMDLESAGKAGEGRVYAFPTFYVGQYEWFHYVEMAKKLRLNAVLMKSREVGYSEIDASLAANSYNCRRNTINLIVANLSDYLVKTLDKVWKALSFLNDYTDGGFFKLRQVVDKTDLKRASHYKVINGQKVETGWMSQIQGIIADKPNKIRGDRTDLLIFEEAGSWPNLTKAYTQSSALVGQPGKQWGFRILGGTGGDSGPALDGLRKMYYNPHMFGILPFRHNYTPSGEQAITAFFIPCFKVMKYKEFFDHRGYVDVEKGRKFYDEARARLAGDPAELVTYSAEYCYNADEAFALEGDNKFNKVALTEQTARIRLFKQGPEVKHGTLDYLFKDNKHVKSNIEGLQWRESNTGPIHIIEKPLWECDPEKDEDGNIIWTPPTERLNGLYVAGIDSIDLGAKDTSEATKDPSDFCIVIKKRVYGLDEPKYVAYYKGRPNDVRDAYKIAMKLAQWYNAPILVEASRMTIISWARDNGYLHMFMRRPSATYPDPTKKVNRNQYGAPATPAVIDHQTDLIADFVNDYSHNIWFIDFLEELTRYTDENKRQFDIVAAMGMAELADEDLHGIVPKKTEYLSNEFQDIGYYTDERGYKRFGIIPKKQQYPTQVDQNWHHQQAPMHTSDPRYYYGNFS